MDGKSLLREVRESLLESSNSTFMSERTTYGYLWDAAIEFADQTGCLQKTASITTVAEQAAYDLPADYLRPWQQDNDFRWYLKINDGTNNHLVYWTDYGNQVRNDADTSKTIPDNWSIIPAETLESQLTGTATSTSASVGGKSSLIDTAADFSTVSAGDIVHNTTDGSDGIVLAVTSTTQLEVSLFEGSANDWTSGDAYVIQPQTRQQIVFSPAFSTAGYTVTFYYVQRPAPVFHDYGMYRFPVQVSRALAKYAAWMYKYRDQKPNEADPLFMVWDRALRQNKRQSDRGLIKNKSIQVNFMGRR